MQLSTIDTQSEFQVREDVFSYPYNEGLIHQAIVAFMNGGRSGTSAQKTRAEVRGGGQKPWKQKGSGRARAGTIRSPIWRSGGVTFASKQRDYAQKINKKMYKRAIRSILSELCRKESLIVMDAFKCDSPKTKEFIQKLESLNLSNVLIVATEMGENEYLGSRNLIHVTYCDVHEINPLLLLKHEKVVFTKDAIQYLEEQLQ